MTLLLFLLASILLSSSTAADGDVNTRPIIGIVSERDSYHPGHSYIAASYVKYLESAGARVVPILNNSTEEQLSHLFHSINGVLFPGGGVDLGSSDYGKVGALIYKMAVEANDKGDYFPLWGTCLGFELLSFIQAGEDKSVLSHVDAENLPLALDMTSEGEKSRLFFGYTEEAIQWLVHENITFNNHVWGVTMKTFNSNSKLNTFFDVLSTNKDRKGVEFVSTVEAKKYPIYGVQWHPEKNGFEWTTSEAIPHSEHAVAVMQMAANFFVQEARKSSHKFSSAFEEKDALIYNYSPIFTDTSFTQIYRF